MLTLPKIVQRDAQPYIAMRRLTPMPFEAVIRETVPRLFAWVKDHGVAPVGPPFFKYNVIDMARELEIDFGVPTAAPVTPDVETVAGELPAGRYATLTWFGSYDDLVEVNAVLIGWAQLHRYRFDMTPTPRADSFVSRLEIYPNAPDQVSSPEELQTILAFKLAEG